MIYNKDPLDQIYECLTALTAIGVGLEGMSQQYKGACFGLDEMSSHLHMIRESLENGIQRVHKTPHTSDFKSELPT